jgi:hypothetical protein
MEHLDLYKIMLSSFIFSYSEVLNICVARRLFCLRLFHRELTLLRAPTRVMLRPAIYRQSVPLVAKQIETHDQYFFQLNTCGSL